ncbi:MAG: protoheme IX farnesyltransferase [Parvularcula sp.]
MVEDATSPDTPDQDKIRLSEVGEGLPTGDFHALSAEETEARNKRNLAVALGIVAFIVLVFGTTVLRLAQNTGAPSP